MSEEFTHEIQDPNEGLEELKATIARLEAELEDAKSYRELFDGVEADKNSLTQQNDNLKEMLRAAKEQLTKLQEEVDLLGKPPSGYGVFLRAYDDDSVDIFTSGKKYRVMAAPNIDVQTLERGQSVRVNEAMTVVDAGGFEEIGEICSLREVFESDDENGSVRALVIGHSEEERVVFLSSPLAALNPKAGDSLLVDTKMGIAYERIEKAEVNDLTLEEVPNVRYEDIGGLSRQIEEIKDAVELPFLHPDLYVQYELKPPKGILLYGPPGCGKTLIAKAVANSLAKRMAELRGEDKKNAKSYFINVKGPELLNKFVGETERHIRLIFQRAREIGSAGSPVIVFFDEMESIFRTRGSGISSDVETTIVPQLLSEIDGVEGLENVIVIGASNREDMIDPAILRPGRLDVKIKVERPDAEAAKDIFSKYLTKSLPIHTDDLKQFGDNKDLAVEEMISYTVERMYKESDENRFLEVTYQNGDKEILYFRDFNSGAMIQNIIDRAKKAAIKAQLETGRSGIRVQHLLDAVSAEFAENEDLPNTTNPDDWARISGKKGERIVYIRSLVSSKQQKEDSGRQIGPTSTIGQYL